MLKSVLLLSTIFLISSCQSWSWKPKWYSIDPNELILINADGEYIELQSEASENFSCLYIDDIEDLAAQIERIKNTKSRRKARKILKEHNSGMSTARD